MYNKEYYDCMVKTILYNLLDLITCIVDNLKHRTQLSMHVKRNVWAQKLSFRNIYALIELKIIIEKACLVKL